MAMQKIKSVIKSLRSYFAALLFVIRNTRIAPQQLVSDYGRSEVVDSIPVVYLSGHPYQRGVQQGHQLKDLLYKFRVEAWSYAVLSAQERLHLPRWLANVITKPLLMVLAATYLSSLSDEVRAEVQGLADGSGIPLREVLVNTTVWEVFAIVTGSSTGPLHCSEFAISGSHTGGEGPIFGYNYDVILAGDRAMVDGFLALYVVTPSEGHAYIAPNNVGAVGINTAMNSKGLTFGWDNSYLKAGVRGASENITPFMVVLRDVALRCDTADEAAARLRREPRIQADICVVADLQTTGVVELAGTQSAYRKGDLVYSCNRLQALSSVDYMGAGRPFDARSLRYPIALGSLPRPVTVGDAARVLRDTGAAEGRQIAGPNNTFAVIYQPRQQRLWVSFGGTPSSHGPLRAFDAQGNRHPADDIPAL